MFPAIDPLLPLSRPTLRIAVSHSYDNPIAGQHLPALTLYAALHDLPGDDRSRDRPPDLVASLAPALENHNYPSFLQN